MPRSIVATGEAPAAIGPYSQGVLADGWLFTAGQIALDPRSGEMVGQTAAEQARRALENARAIVVAAGLTLADVVKVTVFLRDLGEFGAVNEVYREYFAAAPPARSLVEVSRLPRDGLIAVEMIARAPTAR
jgi:2-iminobutanoate/2-iminopropanoate deaminase